MISFTNRQARQFILLKQGFIDEYKFTGKQGAYDFARQAGCLQYDPIDICGRNAELNLQSRVKGFRREMLYALLYEDRLLLDYPDKNTSIIPTEDWPMFSRPRQSARDRAAQHPELRGLMDQAIDFIRERGPVSPDDLQLESDFKWRAHIVWSSGNNLSASVMEQLYGAGDLVVHRKQGARKFYDLAERHIPAHILNAPDPLKSDFEFRKWTALKRVGAIGLLWPRSSEALWRMGVPAIKELFAALEADGKIAAATIEGINGPFYFRTEDMPLAEYVLTDPLLKPRCEVLAPLDCFIWDRALIRALFGYHYSWEIYTPAVNRKYGHYVLPLLYGDAFVGRVEAVADRNAGILNVKNIWYEAGVKETKKLKTAVDGCLKRLAKFNDCKEIVYL